METHRQGQGHCFFFLFLFLSSTLLHMEEQGKTTGNKFISMGTMHRFYFFFMSADELAVITTF